MISRKADKVNNDVMWDEPMNGPFWDWGLVEESRRAVSTNQLHLRKRRQEHASLRRGMGHGKGTETVCVGKLDPNEEGVTAYGRR